MKSIVNYSKLIEEANRENAALMERIGILGECLHRQSENLEKIDNLSKDIRHIQSECDTHCSAILALEEWKKELELNKKTYSYQFEKKIWEEIGNIIKRFDYLQEHHNMLSQSVAVIQKEVQEIKGQKFSEFHHLTPRVEKLERLADTINAHQHGAEIFVKKVSNELDQDLSLAIERIEKLEGYMKIEDRVTASDVLLRLSAIESRQDKLNQDFEHKLDIDFKKWQEYFSLYGKLVFTPIPKGTPHKCPVCEGKRKELNIMPSGGYFESECKTCEGKGMVWG